MEVCVVVARIDIGGTKAYAVADLGDAAVELCIGIVLVVGGIVVVFLVVGEDVGDAVIRLSQRGAVAEGELRATPVLGVSRFADERVFVVVLPHVVVEGLLGLVVLDVVHMLLVVEEGTDGVEHDLVSTGQLAVEVEVERWREAVAPLSLVLCTVGP